MSPMIALSTEVHGSQEYRNVQCPTRKNPTVWQRIKDYQARRKQENTTHNEGKRHLLNQPERTQMLERATRYLHCTRASVGDKEDTVKRPKLNSRK